jgi:hypothetical protein
MSDIVISVVSVDKTTPPGKKYSVLEVMYKNQSFQNKAEEKKLNSYYDKPVFEILQDANKGDVFTISRQKDDSGFWKWVGITQGEGATGKPQSGTGSQTSTSGTASRTYVADDVKQVMIIRQSSISSAVNLINGRGPEAMKGVDCVQAVLDTAKKFESFVLGKDAETPKENKAALPAELDDDLGDLPI